MRKVPNYKGFLIMTAVATIGGSALLFGQWTSLGEENDKVVSLQKDIKNDTELKKMLVQSMDKLKATRERLAHLEKGVPDHAYLATMLRDLEIAGKASGIQIGGVSPKFRPKVEPKEGETVEKKPYFEQDIEVVGRGSYADVLRFVQSLDKFPKVVATTTVSMVPKVNGGKQEGLDITIGLRTFMFSEKPKDASAKTARTEVKSHVG